MFSQGGAIPYASTNAALQALNHRGPDGQGVWISPQRDAVLGHTRLSIIDLRTGDQPIADEDNSAWIVANGEFYDYERIQKELEHAGHRLRTRSDSEIALHLYQDLGMQCVHHLRGEYAFVLWDERLRTLFAVRDRYGVKPLFYARHRGVLYIASEMKALFAAGVPARWDAEAVYLSVAFLPPGRTQFEGVHAVPPGYYLTATDQSISLTQYWDTHYPITQGADDASSDAQYIEEFRAVLTEAVRIRLRADVPVGCYLSGGLDSCAVLGVAARYCSAPIRAFTLRFDHEDYDEGAIAQEMATTVGAEWEPILVTGQALADHFAEAVYHGESPCINAHFVGKYLLSRAVRDAGFKVVITGEGADEVLAGYAHFRQDMLGDGTAGHDPAHLELLRAALLEGNKASRQILMSDGQSAGSYLMRRVLGYMPAMFMPFFANVRRVGLVFNADYFAPFRSLDRASLLLESLDVPGRLNGRALVHQSLYLWSKTLLPGYILALLGDRMEMAHSVEGRVPFLDHKVGEFMMRTPVGLKIRGTTEKFLLREAAREVITDTVYRRQKHPFLSPPEGGADSGRMATLIQDTFRSKVVDSVPFLNANGVRGLANRLTKMSSDHRALIDRDVMRLMSQIFLHERFVQQSAA